jgi:2-polyprenyl-3-methyl-5-hydroxy-6-metoxy-1,4-benzoquinol methylase
VSPLETAEIHGRTHRHDHECEVYDARAEQMLATAADDEFLVDAGRPPYPNREHEDFLSFALGQLGDVAGRRILEVGCGSGALAVYLALQGAEVVGIDVSQGNCRVAERRAAVSGVAGRATFRAVPAEQLDDPDGHYDLIVGNQVLHHVELAQAMPNLHRMLEPGGRAVVCEPVLFTPKALSRIRDSKLVTRRFPSRKDTPDERAISRADLAEIVRPFGRSQFRPFQLLCRVENFHHLSDRWFHRLERADKVLLRALPPARALCRYVVVVLDRAG